MSNPAAYPDSLGSPWRALGGLAYTLPALTALSRPNRPALSFGPTTRHNRYTLKGIVRGLPLCLTVTLQRGFTPNRYPARRLIYGN
jgi:hypothetical protein